MLITSTVEICIQQLDRVEEMVGLKPNSITLSGSNQLRTRWSNGIWLLPYNAMRNIYFELECGPMPNVMVALPNVGGALCSTPQTLADAHY